jgi:hypothetical protein
MQGFKHLHNCCCSQIDQKTNARTKMRKQVEDVFPPKLLQAASHLYIGISSNEEKEEIRCQVISNLSDICIQNADKKISSNRL